MWRVSNLNDSSNGGLAAMPALMARITGMSTRRLLARNPCGTLIFCATKQDSDGKEDSLSGWGSRGRDSPGDRRAPDARPAPGRVAGGLREPRGTGVLRNFGF